MEASLQDTTSGGLWNNPRSIQCSKERQDLLRLMKEESQLTNLHKNQINRGQKSKSDRNWKQQGDLNVIFHDNILYTPSGLPQMSNPVKSSQLSQSVQKHKLFKSQKRSAESCRSGNSYEREKFCPGPTRDLEKEKKRLQDIMATGKEESTTVSSQKTRSHPYSEVSKEIDRYQEVLNEIEERRQFLADMVALGQEKKYINIINTEIAQKLQELEILDRASSDKLDAKRECRTDSFS
ncbi:UPF0193 protein EVG1 isoform X1 [Melanotaenia boesemani]|uniref:UPF0193 protein EVG1 isoform X1 n=1 Tax=Melanotaenia boesemani TaxID=1250792 RepID=UPI001C051023|nr:UPF0193 protein EVG1 isoform X1 [Melanotaenia boesemani]XP_041838561.1 UPF0193 protein EVG1 isoform X1 [Melanotaenia boesemani]XP_041838562.1 UPF0193 protein EVG1 isoform X1 [Melanotaenia boesemani]XP_041838563.1 UPF0193 protein EVG1 isoform X1 [Melanotaenia boesemani]